MLAASLSVAYFVYLILFSHVLSFLAVERLSEPVYRAEQIRTSSSLEDYINDGHPVPDTVKSDRAI